MLHPRARFGLWGDRHTYIKDKWFGGAVPYKYLKTRGMHLSFEIKVGVALFRAPFF
jgi:hypothetical protein